MSNYNYGECSKCGCFLEPVWFIEEEVKIIHSVICKTGRKRHAVDYLICPVCKRKECVDDSFDGSWY